MIASGDRFVACLEREAQTRGLSLDPMQLAAAAELQRLHGALLQPRLFPRPALLRFLGRARPVRGLYLWGDVGRGKSLLMDAFFACVPLERKQRAHFHHFMQEIHARLAALKGQSDPLPRVAREISRHVRLLCLDEFHITDITDAMLMRGLLQGLFDQGVVVVATSNAAPDALYCNGLQRGQFLPTIALIKARMEVMHLDGGEDYRRRAVARAGAYHASPGDTLAEQALADIFRELAGGEGMPGGDLLIEGRHIALRRQGGGVVWFGFGELCSDPRGKADYIELARRFHTVLVSGVPQFGPHTLAQARRFLWLVDELYDRRVRLVLSAAVPLDCLAPSGLLGGEFERALSRLAEMGSSTYLTQQCNTTLA